MNQQHARHQMKISNVHASGAQEWLCLECERRVLINWTPAFKRIVLEPGDDRAIHTGAYGGIELGQAKTKKDDTFGPYMGSPVNGKTILH
jgi:hypothetical protein